MLATGSRPSGDLSRALGLTRQAVHGHLTRMQRDGLVVMTGQGRGARWERTVQHHFAWSLEAPLEEDRLWQEVRDHTPELVVLGEPARRILAYGMTEMLNNAIEHSSGTSVVVTVGKDGDRLIFVVSDDGVGALTSVREFFGLESDADAILQIAKGRKTTAPIGHSGQGLFFTSKMFDRFALRCEHGSWLVDNLRHDHAVAPGTGRRGTTVEMTLDPTTTLSTRTVFDAYTDIDAPNIRRSRINVRLADGGGEFLSRSEARRLSHQLEDYEEVVLDFEGVAAVGQGFVDQLFRVWASEHPTTRLTPVNMDDDVEFMVRRGLPTI